MRKSGTSLTRLLLSGGVLNEAGVSSQTIVFKRFRGDLRVHGGNREIHGLVSSKTNALLPFHPSRLPEIRINAVLATQVILSRTTISLPTHTYTYTHIYMYGGQDLFDFRNEDNSVCACLIPIREALRTFTDRLIPVVYT